MSHFTRDNPTDTTSGGSECADILVARSEIDVSLMAHCGKSDHATDVASVSPVSVRIEGAYTVTEG